MNRLYIGSIHIYDWAKEFSKGPFLGPENKTRDGDFAFAFANAVFVDYFVRYIQVETDRVQRGVESLEGI